MKFRILNLFLNLFVGFSRRKEPSKSTRILVRLCRKVIAKIDPKEALKFFFEFENKLYLLESEFSVKYGV